MIRSKKAGILIIFLILITLQLIGQESKSETI